MTNWIATSLLIGTHRNVRRACTGYASVIKDFTADFHSILLADDTPAQIQIYEMNAAWKLLLAHLPEDEAHYEVAFRLHVAKSGRYKYADGFPCGVHVSSEVIHGRISNPMQD